MNYVVPDEFELSPANPITSELMRVHNCNLAKLRIKLILEEFLNIVHDVPTSLICNNVNFLETRIENVFLQNIEGVSL